MPKVFSWQGYRFHFFSNEVDPLENCHIHVQKGANRAKFWIEPEISLAYNYGFSSKELNKFHKVIEKQKSLIRTNGMSILTFEASAVKVWFDEYNMWLALSDGRQLSVPLEYFPRLLKADPAEREKYELSGNGTGIQMAIAVGADPCVCPCFDGINSHDTGKLSSWPFIFFHFEF